MIAASEPILQDPDRYAQAVGILKQEELSPQEELLFNCLVALVVSALALSAAWIVVDSPVFLWAATLSYFALLPIAILNLPLLKRVRVFRRLEREFSLTRPLRLLARRQRGYWLMNALNAFWLLLGVSALYWFLIAVSVWSQGNFVARLGAVNLFALMLSCLLIVPMRRVRQKIAALQSLQSAVALAANGELEQVYYDGLVCLERIQISIEHEQQFAEAGAADAITVRITDAFVAASNQLDPESEAAVYKTIQALLNVAAAQHTRDGIQPVSGSQLSIVFTRDLERNEVTLSALIRQDGQGASRETR